MSSQCLWNACRALSAGLLLMLLGAAMAVIGLLYFTYLYCSVAYAPLYNSRKNSVKKVLRTLVSILLHRTARSTLQR